MFSAKLLVLRHDIQLWQCTLMYRKEVQMDKERCASPCIVKKVYLVEVLFHYVPKFVLFQQLIMEVSFT